MSLQHTKHTNFNWNAQTKNLYIPNMNHKKKKKKSNWYQQNKNNNEKCLWSTSDVSVCSVRCSDVTTAVVHIMRSRVLWLFGSGSRHRSINVYYKHTYTQRRKKTKRARVCVCALARVSVASENAGTNTCAWREERDGQLYVSPKTAQTQNEMACDSCTNVQYTVLCTGLCGYYTRKWNAFAFSW